MESLQVVTASKQYPVYIGERLRFSTGEWLREVLTTAVSRVLIITDEVVASHYLEDVKESLSAFEHVFTYTLPSGEQAKSFEHYHALQTFALEQQLDRDALIIALGGGVVGDIAGFVAATYMRGIRFIQMPTTLLAHDSSVGGKVAINHSLGKNMIGAFHQPEAVLYDIDTFATLPEKEWRSGFAEVIKHALIWDPAFLEWLKTHITSFEDIKGETANVLLKQSIAVKASVVKEDEKESGIRAYLNFGHTLAHAIETESGYGKITHGEAVAIGMIFALKLSKQVYDHTIDIPEIECWFEQYGFSVDIPEALTIDQLLRTMKKDKKAQGGEIRMVLIKAIGEVEVAAVNEELLRSLLEKELGRY